MRITSSMISNSVMYNINKNLYNLNTTYTRMSSGKKIETPSDNPVGASTVLKYSSYLSKIAQYQTNSEDASSWLKVTDSTLTSLSDDVTSVKEKMVQAFNGTLTDSDKADILEEVNQLKDQVVQLCNTDYAGRSIFGGYETESDPVAVDSTAVGDKVTYHGKYLCLDGAVSSSVSDSDLMNFYTSNASNVVTSSDTGQDMVYDTGFNSSVTVNTEATSILGQDSAGLYETLQQFSLYLSGETSYKTIDTSSGTPTVVTKTLDTDSMLSALTANEDTVLGLNSKVGAKESALELSIQRLTDGNEIYKTLLSETQDVDVAEVSVEYSQAQSVYQESLSAASKLVLPSLLSFLS